MDDLASLKAWGATHLFVAVHRRVNGSIVDAALDLRFQSIFVEKPPATSLAELESLVFKAKICQARVCVGMNFRYAALVEEARRMILRDGGLLDLDVCFDGKPIATGAAENSLEAALLEFGIHALDLAQYVAPELDWFPLHARWMEQGTHFLYVGRSQACTGTVRIRTGSSMFSSCIKLLGRNGLEVSVINFAEIRTQLRSVSGLGSDLRSTVSLQPSPRDFALNKAGYLGLIQDFLAGGRGIPLNSIESTYQLMEKAFVSVH